MRRMLAIIVVSLLAGFAAQAHPGHGSAVSEDEAVRLALAQVKRLVEDEKLDKSWALKAKLQEVELRQYDGAAEYAVVFFNPEAGGEKATLYVFITETGDYVAANFTGN